MLAGGMTIAAPSMMVPEAQAAGALYVSAENAMFGNTFGGAQIIEVVVIGHASETDEKQGEPVVKVDENQLRMAQAVDGNWYGYFGDSTAVVAADRATNNLNFGADATPTVHLGDFAEAANVYSYSHPDQADGVLKNAPTLSAWNGTDLRAQANNSPPANYTVGQIGLLNGEQDWPVIQLYDFTIGNFDVVYEQAGADEVVSLDYNSADLDDFASLTLDRNSASQGSDVHLVITDNQLNIDPTAEDIVIFYHHSDGRGAGGEGVSFTNSTLADATAGYEAGDYLAFDNTFDDNGKLLINNATNGGSSVLANDATIDDPTTDAYMVFYEGGENSGIFYNTDDDDDANLDVDDYAKRGFTATFDYNDSAQSFVVANDFGVIDMEEASVGDAWNSGEALTVTLIDQDLNKNSASDEDLAIKNTTRTHLIPSLQINDPLMLTANTTAVAGVSINSVSDFSNIAYVDVAVNNFEGGNLTIMTGWSGTELAATNNADQETSYFNYDVTAFLNSTNTMTSICLQEGNAAASSLACDDDSDGRNIVQVTGSAGTTTALANVAVDFSVSKGLGGYDSIPVALDVFSYGPGINKKKNG
jgi:hypothetical protein